VLIPRNRQIHSKLEILRPDNTTWVDVTKWLVGGVRVSTGNVRQVGTGSSGVDSRVRRMEFALLNETAASFSPQVQDSTWNQFGGQYSPLLWPNREVRFQVAVTSPGASPTSGDWVTLFHGYLGDVIRPVRNKGQSRVVCSCRDLAKKLMDKYIITPASYGSAEGVPAETVIQQILDDNFGAGTIPLYCPVSPGFNITSYDVEYVSAWDAVQKVAMQIGWYLGYLWDSGTEQFRLTLIEPDREKATADYDLANTDDIYAEELDITDRDVRNAITVTYRDAATGERVTLKPDDYPTYLLDQTSIDSYGRRDCQFEEADTSLIDTQQEALDFGYTALQDLKDLPGTVRLDMPLLPGLDIFNTVQIINPNISTDPQLYGIVSVEHVISKNKARTYAVGAGRVIGAHKLWLKKETRPGAKKPVETGEISHDAIDADRIQEQAIELGKFSDRLRPVQIVDSLPSLPNSDYPQGAVVFLTSENKLYRSTGTAWTAEVPTADLDGEITETQISDDAISTPKLQAGAVTGVKIASKTITAENLAADSVTAGKIAAATITADKYAEIRNVLPYNDTDYIGAGYPIEVDFYIPSETIRIEKVLLTAKALPFRSYATTSIGGGGTTSESSLDDAITFEVWGASEDPFLIESERDAYDWPNTDQETDYATTGLPLTLEHTVNDEGHSHSVNATASGTGSHRHSISEHSHNYYVPPSTTEDASPTDPHKHSITTTIGATSQVSLNTSWDGYHSHTVTGSADINTTGITVDAHELTEPNDGQGHKHTIPYTAIQQDHRHIVNIGHGHVINISHTHDIPPHSHSMTQSIILGTTPDGVKLYCDDGAGYDAGQALATAPDSTTPYVLCEELDITSKFSGTGWKRIKFDNTTRLGRIYYQLIVKVDLTA